MQTIRKGTMRRGVKLLGTRLNLEAGQHVRLVPATNLPTTEDVIQWYASPLDGNWPDGEKRNRHDSILINHDDVEVDFEHDDV